MDDMTKEDFKKRVTVVNFGMSKRSNNGTRSKVFFGIAIASKITHMIKA